MAAKKAKPTKPGQWIILVNKHPTGWPEPFRFQTRIDALRKAHMIRYRTFGMANVVVTRKHPKAPAIHMLVRSIGGRATGLCGMKVPVSETTIYSLAMTCRHCKKERRERSGQWKE